MAVFYAPLPRGPFRLRGLSTPEHIVIIISFAVTVVAFTAVFAAFIKQLGSANEGKHESYELQLLGVHGAFINGELYRIDIKLTEPLLIDSISGISLRIGDAVYNASSFRVLGQFGLFTLYGDVELNDFQSTVVNYNGSTYMVVAYIDENERPHLLIRTDSRAVMEFNDSGVCSFKAGDLTIECIPILLAELGPWDSFNEVPIAVLAYSLRSSVLVLSGYNNTIDTVTLLLPKGSNVGSLVINIGIGDDIFRVLVDVTSSRVVAGNGITELVYSVDRG